MSIKASRWKDDERPNANARGYDVRWRRARASALRRDKHLCVICRKQGKITPAEEVDHIVPLGQGGTHQLGNLQSICTYHHRDKTAREALRAQGKRVRHSIGIDGFPLEEGAGGP